MFHRLLFVVLTLFVSCATLQAESHSNQQVKIGAILPLTGPTASFGQAMHNGMEMAYRKLPESVQKQFVIVYEDDEGKPNKSVSAFRKLVDRDRVVALIGNTAQPSLAIAPLAEQLQIPFISVAVPPDIAVGRKWVVMLFATPESMAELMVQEVLHRNYQRIARISSIHDGRHVMKKYFDRSLNSRATIVLDEEYALEERDFRTFIAKTRSANVDAVYVNLMLGQAGLFARQARELQLQKPLFTSEMFEDPHELELSRGALQGHWFVNQANPPDAFLKMYLERYPGERTFLASNGYDVLNLLAATISKDSRREKINEFLHTFQDFPGILGRYAATNDPRIRVPVSIKEVTSQGFRELSISK